MRKPGVQEAGRPERHDGFLKPKDFQDLLDSWFPFLMDSNLVPLMRLLEKCKSGFITWLQTRSLVA